MIVVLIYDGCQYVRRVCVMHSSCFYVVDHYEDDTQDTRYIGKDVEKVLSLMAEGGELTDIQEQLIQNHKFVEV